MQELYIRTNGRGNAWPIPLGQDHPFYDKQNSHDLANASYSIIKRTKHQIEAEILIDAGHGIIPFLLQNSNRIPEALVLTHPHIDHTLSIDWLAQSYFKLTRQKYPVYASKLCWDRALMAFPQLEKIVEFKELLPANEHYIKEFKHLSVTFYPVFHGESAPGAGMLFFKYRKKSVSKALFTGDLLCPLLRTADYEELLDCKVIYVDSNNRFPYPKSNHWSVAKPEHFKQPTSKYFYDWYSEKGKNLLWMTRPNTPIEFNPLIHNYFNDFIAEQNIINDIPFNVFDFAEKIQAENVNLIHYSGAQDKNYYGDKILNERELAEWANASAKNIGLITKFNVPKVGDEFVWA